MLKKELSSRKMDKIIRITNGIVFALFNIRKILKNSII